MVFREFKSDRRLWIGVSILLFVIFLILQIIDCKMTNLPLVSTWLDDVSPPILMENDTIAIGILFLIFGVSAVAIGWVLQ
jgi:hypothetical protein